MTSPGITAVRVVRGAKTFHVHGTSAGAEGVWLAEGQVEGIYDSPVQTTWKTGAFQEGSFEKYPHFLHRDMTLGFHVKDTTSEYSANDSAFRQIFDYELDPWETTPTPTTIQVDTTLSGTRSLDVLLYEAPVFHPDQDPIMAQFGNLILKLRAGQPFWYSADTVTSFTSSATSASGTVSVANPTDRVAYQKWVLTRGTFTLPDFQWVGARGSRVPGGTDAARTISGIVVSASNGGATIDLDKMELMFRDANNTNILAQMAGKFFLYPIPPYTPAQTLPVSYTGAPAGGAMIQLRVPQRWTRPWGMELV